MLLPGCLAYSSLQRAEVVEPGETRVGWAPAALHTGQRQVIPIVLPGLATVRHGLGHGLDLGARFWLVGAGLGLKYQFVDAAPFAVSVAPEVSVMALNVLRDTAVDLTIPVLAGFGFGPHQLILGANVVLRNTTLTNGAPERRFVAYPGAVVGLDFALGPHVHVLPETAVTWWVGGGEVVWTTTLGLQFDIGQELREHM